MPAVGLHLHPQENVNTLCETGVAILKQQNEELIQCLWLQEHVTSVIREEVMLCYHMVLKGLCAFSVLMRGRPLCSAYRF